MGELHADQQIGHSLCQKGSANKNRDHDGNLQFGPRLPQSNNARSDCGGEANLFQSFERSRARGAVLEEVESHLHICWVTKVTKEAL